MENPLIGHEQESQATAGLLIERRRRSLGMLLLPLAGFGTLVLENEMDLCFFFLVGDREGFFFFVGRNARKMLGNHCSATYRIKLPTL